MYAVLSAIRARNQHNLIFWNEGTGHSIYLDSANSANLALVHLIHSWLVWAENECPVHVVLPKWPKDQFKPVQQSRQHELRAYCPNIYTVERALNDILVIVWTCVWGEVVCNVADMCLSLLFQIRAAAALLLPSSAPVAALLAS